MKKSNQLDEVLSKHFNYSSFRLGQKEIVVDILDGKDVFGILPTGSGKSLCYQLPAKLLNGITIVVSPLISLMIDQVKQLKANGFKEVIALNSFMNRAERNKVYQNLNKYKLIYVSPELLQQKQLMDQLSKLEVSLFVIDEAHCISQWGHEFRPDYLRLRSIIDTLNNPPILALSATATTNVQQDIIDALNRPDIIKHIYPMDRENITFCVQEVTTDSDKISKITNLVGKFRVPTIIYFSSRNTTEQVAEILSKNVTSTRIAFYHGGMEQQDRIAIQQQFMNDQLDVICCTSAFGMGINKSNIRLVIHYHFPPQIESYIQEIGRAGRDGGESISLLLFSNNDPYIPAQLIKRELPPKSDVSFIFHKMLQLYKGKLALPENEQEVKETFHIGETQFRFLHYQFEKHGMINGNQIVYDRLTWDKAFTAIINLIESRLLLKEDKLNEMLHWIYERGCLREHLYKSFQDSFNDPQYSCCSNCGFDFSAWRPEQTEYTPINSDNWQTRLKSLLINGEYNEAE
ncbi:RecQ family ATP-dependent DNA helicase [Virgibacillus byunsanensis]|uniref:RecQ family ATP-dependent DNA helicase n=1 Tax=Virgibacillus byunsanensis TaxID=570945 RepID=A0ABW3LM85_9BACI